jgi:Tfp pilus assembly protein PilV
MDANMLRHHTSRACSSVEVLVALAVLGCAALGVYAQFLATGRRGHRHLDRTQARYLAQQELEQLRAAPFDRLKDWKAPQPAFYPGHPQFVYQDQVTSRPADGLLELTVCVGWDMPLGGPFASKHSVTVKGLKAP